jgi:quercetin dioxygenase-like cupin family protein
MRRFSITLLLILSIAAVGQQAMKSKDAAKSQPAKTEARHVYTQAQMQWGPAPPFIPPGAQVTVLEGDPGASSGDFTIRVKVPDGYVVPPHWHPARENVTVISGTMRIGMGDKIEESKMTPLAPGGFAYLDPTMHHYVRMKGATVVQIHGASPLAFNYVNASDDPRNKK